MIKLTLNPDFHPTTSIFHKKSVTIGSTKSHDVDLAIPDDQLQDIHVKIVEQEGRFFVINHANDPFVALNDRPFGKKEIKTGDHLSIRDDSILFEGRIETAAEAVSVEEKKEVKKPWINEKSSPSPKIEKGRGKRLITIASFFLGMLLLTAGGIYLRMSKHIDAEEIKAAEGVADVAIALTYAKINRETPQKMDWSDPAFLNRMLHAVISNQNAPTIGSNGQFKEWPFIVRIYSSGDLSRFLVMAQPVPSLLHWFIPQKTILLDSASMELRRTRNVKDLNRLLANMDSFEGGKAEEVSALVNREKLIPLSKLAKGGNRGFGLPGGIDNNFIYNAPRYYSMGEAILNQAVRLLEAQGNGREITQLKFQLDVISQLPYFIFYSTKGKESALEGLKALSTITPSQNFLVGFVKLNESGAVSRADLIEPGDSVIKLIDPAEQMAMQTSQLILETEKPLPLFEVVREKQQEEISSVSVDFNHPLFLKLKALMNIRQQNLNIFTEDLIEKLRGQNQQPQPEFLKHFQERLTRYDQESRDQQQKIIQEMLLLNQKFSSIPFAEFYSYAKAAGMQFLLEEFQKQSTGHILTKEEFENYLVEIKESRQLQELDHVVSELSHMLILKNIPDCQTLILYQNAVSYQTLQKLTQFLLKPVDQAPQKDKRDQILHILKTSWISDPEVVEYFLNEYDLSVQNSG